MALLQIKQTLCGILSNTENIHINLFFEGTLFSHFFSYYCDLLQEHLKSLKRQTNHDFNSSATEKYHCI